MIGDSIASALMKKALDGSWQRQKAIANNIANHETPGYKAVKVSFENELKNEVQRLGKTGFSGRETFQPILNSKVRYIEDQSFSERADGNSVNLEVENIEMAKTQIQYQFLTRAMADFYSRLRYAISEGKR